MDKCDRASDWKLVEVGEAFNSVAFIGSGQEWRLSRPIESRSAIGTD